MAIIAVIADTHIGSTVGLSLPTWVTTEDQTITYNKAQEWLYESWKDYWRHVYRLKKETGKKLITVHLGDVIDGLHHGRTQVLPELIDQENMACEILKPIRNISDYLVLTYGTEAHAGPVAESEQRIAKMVGFDRAAWTIVVNANGIILDCAHHGRAGGRDWTSAGANMAAEIALEYAIRGAKPPRYVLRAHRHTIDTSGNKLEGIEAISCPSWQLKTAFGEKAAAGKRADIGGLVIVDGMVDWSRARYKAAPGQKETIVCK